MKSPRRSPPPRRRQQAGVIKAGTGEELLELGRARCEKDKDNKAKKKLIEKARARARNTGVESRAEPRTYD